VLVRFVSGLSLSIEPETTTDGIKVVVVFMIKSQKKTVVRDRNCEDRIIC